MPENILKQKKLKRFQDMTLLWSTVLCLLAPSLKSYRPGINIYDSGIQRRNCGQFLQTVLDLSLYQGLYVS